MHETQKAADVLAILTPDALPEIGFIAFHVSDRGVLPISAGFLRKVEGGYGQIDTLVSNATLPGSVRHRGVSQVVDALINEAKLLKLHGLICLTKDAGTLKRAAGLGFQTLPQSVITLSLADQGS